MPRRRSSAVANAARSGWISSITRSRASTSMKRMPSQPRPRVALDHVGGEVLQLGEALQPGVAAADEDEREQRAARRLVVLDLGLLEP